MNDNSIAKHRFDIITDAIQGKRGPEQQRLAEQSLAWVELLLAKNRDYGSSVFERPMLAQSCDIADGILIRMGDKINRLKKLASNKGQAEVAESFEDTIRDLGAYCLLYLCRPVNP